MLLFLSLSPFPSAAPIFFLLFPSSKETVGFFFAPHFRIADREAVRTFKIKCEEESCLKLLCQQHHLSSPPAYLLSQLSLKATSKPNHWET